MASRLKVRGQIRLRVPLYKQHYDFTCGPAALMMAMRHLEPKTHLSRDLEMDIWREATMIETYGTSRYGLAFSASRRGFRVTIYTNLEGYGYVEKIRRQIGNLDTKMLRLLFEERRRRCLKEGIEERRTMVTLGTIADMLSPHSIPILLTSAKHFSDDDIPHWVVITGMDREKVYVNNSLAKRTDVGIPTASFSEVIGYKGDLCVLAISKR